jgi:hypothetical protein
LNLRTRNFEGYARNGVARRKRCAERNSVQSTFNNAATPRIEELPRAFAGVVVANSKAVIASAKTATS